MRRVQYSVATSLDGFIADPNGAFDWILTDPAIDFDDMFEPYDAFVMGRKTWEVTTPDDYEKMFAGKEVVVFSRTLKQSPYPNVSIVGDRSPADVVRELKERPGKDIWLFGGGEIFRQVVDAGLVDVVEVGLMPVLLSEGIPMLPPGRQIRGMKLTSCRTMPSGILMLTYELSREA